MHVHLLWTAAWIHMSAVINLIHTSACVMSLPIFTSLPSTPALTAPLQTP